jgi:hypothetical protein
LHCGTVKSVYAEACDFDYWASGALYGRGRSRVAVGCRFGDVIGAYAPLIAAGSLLIVDGVDVSYADGVFTLVRADADPNAWNLMPGMALNWQSSAGGFLNAFTHDLGTFYVTRIYDDATNIYVETTSPHATVPSWSSGKVLPERSGSISFIECYGGDNTRRMTEATRAGERIGEYFKDIFIGKWSIGGNWRGRGGILTRIVVNVRQATAVGGSKIIFTTGTFTADAIDDPVNLEMDFDLTIKGKRDFTLDALTGKVGTDDVLLDSVSQTELPANRLCSGYTMEWFTTVNPADHEPSELPIVEVEMYFDGGLYLRPLVAYAGFDGSAIGAVTGTPYP